MYALHLACKSLQAGDCSAAVVGGTNLIFGIEQQIGSVRLGTLSPTSICHTFDESADGYARAEAVGSVFIKRLSDAIRDKDPIRAVIRATSINT
jgi:acyl transferase domain-containing protein